MQKHTKRYYRSINFYVYTNFIGNNNPVLYHGKDNQFRVEFKFFLLI